MRRPRLTGKEVAKAVERFGFRHTTGSNSTYKHADAGGPPYHAGEEIGPGLLNKIIKRDLGVTRQEFMEKL